MVVKREFRVIVNLLLTVMFIVGLFGKPQASPVHAEDEVKPKAVIADPSIGLNLPATSMLGSPVNFSVTFDNPDSSQEGYGPFIEVYLDVTGVDGIYPGTGATIPSDVYDGLGTTSISYTYAGLPINTSDVWELELDVNGEATHPILRDSLGNFVTISAPAQFEQGDKVIIIRLPFGSFVPDQPAATINFSVNMSNLADLGQNLYVAARGGYQYGETPLDDWCCGDDPSDTLSGFITDSVVPTLLTVLKDNDGYEGGGETATGPNYERDYTITVSAAPGQTITNLDLTEVLPNNVQYVGPVTGATCSPLSEPSTSTPGGTLSCTIPSFTGSVSISFPFYIPLRDSVSASVVDPVSGDDVNSCNNVAALGDWTPIDSRDTGGTDNASGGSVGAPCEDELADKSIETQKGVSIVNDTGAVGASPGDTLEYVVNFQVSDYFAFENVFLTDLFSDGQHFDSSFTPQLYVSGNGFESSVAVFDAANFDVSCNYTGAVDDNLNCTQLDAAADDGTTTMLFRVSDELIARSFTGKLIGGCVPTSGTGGTDPNCGSYDDGGTVGTIRFRTVIQENFTNDFPSGDSSVDQGDILTNAVDITGDLLQTTDVTTLTGETESDGSGASVSIARGPFVKSIYAINGNTALPSPVRITVGDEVTYRLQYTLITSDVEDLQFTDYFPLPIFHVDDADGDGLAGPPWGFIETVDASVPAPGVVKFGPADTFYDYTVSMGSTIHPSVSRDVVGNSITVVYGDFNGTSHISTVVDLLFTVTVADDPFADGLYLTNQASVEEGSTNSDSQDADSIVQILFTAPALYGEKSIVSTNGNGTLNPSLVDPNGSPWAAPGTIGSPSWTGTVNSDWLSIHPIDSNLEDSDAGDLVTFAITIENRGTGINGAFDIVLKDVLDSAHFRYPGGDPNNLNLKVYYGNGTGPIDLAAVDSYDPYGSPPIQSSHPISTQTEYAAAFFGTGITLVDPVGAGVCSAHDPNLGNNVIIITYDLELTTGAEAGDTYTNTATLVNYAGQEGGENFIPNEERFTAEVSVNNPELTKSFLTTSVITAGTSNDIDSAVIGEKATFQLVATVPEGTTADAQIVDILSSGLAFVEVTSVTYATNVSSTNTIGTGVNPGNVTIGDNGGTANQLTFDFGDIVNANTDGGSNNTITIEYDVVVLNVNGNQSATSLNNSATLTWSNGSSGPVSDSFDVVEPDLNITKTAQRLLPTAGGTSIDAGDTVQYTISITNSSGVDAFDAAISDSFPAYLDWSTLSLDSVTDSLSVLTTTDFNLNTSTGVLTTVNPFDMLIADTRTVTLTITGVVVDTINPTRIIQNTARVTWTSLDGVVVDQSTHNTDSDERTGVDGPGSGLNNYAKDSSVNVSVPALSGTKYLITSSEAGTLDSATPPRLTIGEIVRYRLVALVPEGLSTDLSLFDQLPAGLQFINDSQVKAAFVSDGTASNTFTSSTIDVVANPTVEITGSAADPATLLSANIVYGLPDTAVSRLAASNDDVYGSGTDVYFKFGNVSNLDNDANNEYIVVEFNALVLNISTNQGVNNSTGANIDTNLDNNFRGIRNTSTTPITDFTSANIRTRIAEPAITNFDKTVSPTSGDAGNTVSYQVTFSNTNVANASPAYDVEFTDIVPAKMDNIRNLVVTSACAIGQGGSGISDHDIQVTFTELPIGCAVTITYDADLTTAVIPSEILTNNADITYTSLPGSNGTTTNPTNSSNSGTPGDSGGERIDGSTLNDYQDSDTVNVEVTPIQPVKSLIDSDDATTIDPDLTIGEIARYRMEILIAEGSSPAFIITDNLPTGLMYNGNPTMAFVATGNTMTSSNTDIGSSPWISGDETTLSSVSPSFAVPASAISGGPFSSGTNPVFAFSDLANAETDANQEFVVVEFDVIVVNESGNHVEATRTSFANNYVVSIAGSDRGTSNTVTTYVVEPQMAVSKGYSLDGPADAGVEVTYTITVTNPSANANNATAYDIHITDQVLTGTTIAGVTTTPTGGVSGITDNTSGDTLDITVDVFPVDGQLVITYTIIVPDSIEPNDPIDNDVAMTWTSTDSDTNTEERTGDDGVSGPLDDYAAEDSTSFDIDDVSITKSLTGTSANHTLNNDLTIGEVASFEIQVTFPDGTITAPLSITDNLPVGFSVLPATIVVDDSGLDSTLVLGDVSAVVDTTTNPYEVLEIGYTANFIVSSADSSGNVLVITYDAVVNDAGENVDGLTKSNAASVTWDSQGPINATPVDMLILEPLLQVDKNFTPNPVGLGQTATYTINLSHDTTAPGVSSTDAFDVLIEDVIPTGLVYLATTIGGSCDSGILTPNDSSAPNLSWTVDHLPLGESCQLTYQVTVSASGLNETLTNSVTGGYSTLPGTPTPDEERDYTLSTYVDLVTTGPDLRVDKTDSGATGVPGGNIVYAIEYWNDGNGDATNVVITESIPQYTTFNDAATTAAWVCGASSCTLDLGTLAPAANGIVDFVVTVDAAIPTGVTQTTNGVSIADDGNHGTDPTPSNNSDTDTTPLDANPDLEIIKTDAIAEVTPGGSIVYTLTYDNIGVQDATGVEIEETVPVGTSFTTTGSSAGWSCLEGAAAGTTCTLTLGAVPVSDPAGFVTFAVVVDDPIADGIDQIDNTASIADDGLNGPEPMANNEDDEDTPVNAVPDLTITKVDDFDPTTPGSTIIYTISYDNVGDQTATGVVITETVPDYTTFNAGDSDPSWSCTDVIAGSTCTYSVGTLTVGGGSSIAFAVDVINPVPSGVEQIDNTVSITDDGNNGPEPTPENNTDTEDTTLNAAPDLSVTKVDDVSIIQTGQLLTYTIDYANIGNQDATGVVITETVPDYTTFASEENDPAWVCTPDDNAGSICNFPIGNLDAGDSGQISFVVFTDAAIPETVENIYNQVSITDDGNNGEDEDLSNNSDDETTPIDALPDLRIAKSYRVNGFPDVSALPGEVIIYSLAYENIGDQYATGVVITETVPEHTQFNASESNPAWVCADISAGSTCTYAVGLLVSDASGAVLFAVTIDDPLASGVDQIDNAVVINDDGTNGTDPTPENNEDDASTPVDATSDLTITKDDGVVQVSPGEALVYTILVGNVGTQSASGVIVTDTLPEGVVFESASNDGVYDDLTREIKWDLGILEPGEEVSLTVNISVEEPFTGLNPEIVNEVIVEDDGANGTDPTPENNEDDDRDLIGESDKVITNTNQTFTSGLDVAIGEVVTYQVTLDLAPGLVEDLVFTDILDQGMAFIGCNEITTDPAEVLTLQPGYTLGGLCTMAAVTRYPLSSADPTDNGRQMVINFGDVTNSSESDITLTISYDAVILNSISNVDGTSLGNQASWAWVGGSLEAAATPVTIVEPDVTITKSVTPETAYSNQIVTYTLTIQHTSDSHSEAFNLNVTDTLPVQLTYVPGSLIFVSGQVPTVINETGAPFLQMGWDVFNLTSDPTVITYQAEISGGSPNSNIVNDVVMDWTSLPGDVDIPQTVYNISSVERSYTPGSNVDVYGVLASAVISIPALPETGFAPNVRTILPEQPQKSLYTAMDELRIRIPKQNIDLPIVGVPITEEGWDLTWLSNQVGYLEGTAYPTWNGNTGLTAHVYNADGTPGPFVNLQLLRWGDKIEVTAFGKVYTYEVRSVTRVGSNDLSVLNHEDRPWLTLITCQGYDETTDQYLWRVVVKAVLVSVKE